MITRHSLTREYLSWPLTDDDIEVIDGTTSVDFAFMAVDALGLSDDPATGDWEVGTIADNGADADPRYDLAILVGPSGDVTLSPGLYRVWVRLTDAEERPVRAIDWLEVT